MTAAVTLRIIAPLLATALGVAAAGSAPLQRGQQWVASWTASVHGPYPAGNPVAQPALDKAFESAERGAVDQTFRLIVRPTLWGPRVRLRFANTFGKQPITLDDIFVGLQAAGGVVATGTNQRVTFGNGKTALTLPAGGSLFSDPVALPFALPVQQAVLQDRKLAISFHVVGATGPMTWHAKALQTSYLSAPRSGSHSDEESDAAFPFTTTSWYFLDAVDVQATGQMQLIVCLGDSITDGTGSTLNGDDRWPDVLARRLRAAYGSRFAVVNAGIGGNRITGPSAYDSKTPFAGGPSALDRLERDVLSLSGLSTVIWLEGINDLSSGASAEAVIAGITEGVRRIRARGGVRIIMATITPALGATAAAGTPEVDARRQAVNAFIRSSDLFDGVADFDAATRDTRTGGLRAELQPNSSIGGPGDALHPNRAGYLAMANAVDLGLLTTPPRR
jgi:lysophospholipase L1-like esterase